MVRNDHERSAVLILPWAAGRPPAPGSDDYQKYARLYTSMGQSIMMWAMLESAVHLAARMMFHKFDGVRSANEIWSSNALNEDAFPHGLSKQLTLIEKVIRKNPDLVPWKFDLEALCKAIRSRSSFRNLIVHGKISDHDHFRNAESIKIQKAGHPDREISVGDLESFFVNVRALANEMNRIVISIAEEMARRDAARRDGSNPERGYIS